MKKVIVLLAGCILAYFGWTTLYPQKAVAANGMAGATYLITITDASNGAFSSRSVITLSVDHSMAAIDSAQGGPSFSFSSQQGAWENAPGNTVKARALDFDFPSLDVARLDYNFTTVSNDRVAGTIVLTIFPLTGNPLGSGGTVIGTFNFTGQRVSVP
jgi:hypothetical protein